METPATENGMSLMQRWHQAYPDSAQFVGGPGDTARARFMSRNEFSNTLSNIEFLDRTGSLRPGVRVLEIGSGRGTMLQFLISQGYEARGVEHDPDQIEKCRERYGDLPVERTESADLPFPDASFDVVLSFDVFEHIPDSDHHLREVQRVLRDGGEYLLQTPNKWTNSVFETIRWRSLTSWRAGHCSLHSHAQLIRRFRRHGLEPEFFDIPVVTDYFRAKVRAYLGGLGPLLLRVVNIDRLPMPLRTNFFVRARKTG